MNPKSVGVEMFITRAKCYVPERFENFSSMYYMLVEIEQFVCKVCLMLWKITGIIRACIFHVSKLNAHLIF